MSARSNGVEWVETAEEVIIGDSLSPVNTSAVIPVLEPSETPIQRLLETVGHGDNPEADEGFYCKECVPLFQDQSDPTNLNGPSFILDFPTTVGVPQRALLSIPYGLTIGRSSIPGAGIGVINHGPTVSPGMHFGPLEGEVTTRESAMESVFSWEIYKGKAEYEYIDAARDSHSNWMRYVNCARNKDETNLLAVQYKGSILFHCCRTIQSGDELMVWPSSKLLNNFSSTWMQLWLMRLKMTENGSAATHQIFLCSDCRLSFTTEAFLQRHTQHFHSEPKEESTPAAAEVEEPYSPASNTDGEALPTVLSHSVDAIHSLTCSDCGKVFKQMPHLRRHKLCVHSNKRPYCCPHCRRSFSQASGLIRHQLVHRKKTVIKETVTVRDQNEKGESTAERSELLSAAEPNEEEEAAQESEDVQEAVVVNKPKPVARKADPPQRSCVDCGKTFASEGYLRKHRLTVHKGIRPYVCTVCQQCFGQYSDLNRHLRGHQKEKKRSKTINQDSEESTFICTVCSLEFSSAESFQQHKCETHPQEGNQENYQSQDPDFSPPKSVSETVKSHQTPPSQRPRRLGARSKVSAITKLIAPKRRAAPSTSPNTSSDQTENSSPEPEEPPAKNGKFKKFKWFGCNRCKRTYSNQEDLKAHKCALKQHKCGQCGATFIKSGFLKRHEQTAHANNQSFTCERCDKVFTNSTNLKQHQKSNKCKKYHCTSELFSCTFCQFSFTMKSYLIKHIKRHHPVEYLSLQDSEILVVDEDEDRACICPNCGETFENGKTLKAHACYQQVKVLYLCTDCGKGFTNHYGLKQHQRIHTGEKPYNCPHCTKSFSYAGQLNVHLRTHTGEKPYLCTHCGDSFRQSGDLKRHERKHTGVRPYSCPECCKSFSRPQSLKAHQMLHLGQRMFKCTQCGKSFSRNYHLRRHHQKMHL